MILIKKLNRPMKKSGFLLPLGETTEIRGMVIVNAKHKDGVYIDKFTPNKKKGKKK